MSDNKKQADFEPEVVMLYCRNCIRDDADITAGADRVSGFTVRAVAMPCSSKAVVPHMLRILENGADAVQVVACPENRCRHLVGSCRAKKRIDYARGLLEKIQIGAERIGLSRAQNLAEDQLFELAGARADAVRTLGPNPMKKGVVK